VKRIPAGTQLVRWSGVDKLPETIRHQVVVNGAGKVRVSLRYKPDDRRAPLVCHLLNQNYDIQADDVRPTDVTVSISRSFLNKVMRGVPKRAVVRTPRRPPQEIPVKLDSDRLTFSVPNLGFWAIVEISAGG